MKKTFITLFAAVLAVFANAQSSLEIREHATSTVATGATYNFWIASNSGTHTIEFDAFNISNSSVTYKVTKTNVTIDAGASSWFCVFHNGDATDAQSHCYLPAVTTTAHTFVTDAGEFNSLSCDFSPGTNNGVSIVRYKVFDVNNTADSAVFTLVYNVTPAGIASVLPNQLSVGSAYPNPSSGQFNFTADAVSGPLAVSVYSIDGSLVKSESCVMQNGTISIDLSQLPNGVYLCRFSSGEMISSEQRLIIAK